MDEGSIKARVRDWLVRLFIRSINGISTETDRGDVLHWLARSRDVVAGDAPVRDKFTDLYSLVDTRRTAQVVMNSVVEGVRTYRKADLPLSVKIAVPATLLAAPFLGGHGAGIVAAGGAVGLPVLLLLFLGTAGITAILEAFATRSDGRSYLTAVLACIAEDEALRQVSAAMKKAMREDAREPHRAPLSDDGRDLRTALLEIDPYDFERHVMSFFATSAIEKSWVTRKSNDMGVDGFAKKWNGGLIVVQCKRHGPDNPVGSPDVQRFKGVIEENGAAMGYIVTTSRFTAAACESASMSDRLALVDMDDLVRWHQSPPSF